MKYRGVLRDAPYILVHRGVVLNSGLSLKARGLYAMLSAWDPGEPITVAALLKFTKDGRGAVTAAWEELRQEGLLEVPRTRGGVVLHEHSEKSAHPSKEFAGKTEMKKERGLVVRAPHRDPAGQGMQFRPLQNIAENPECVNTGVAENRQEPHVQRKRKTCTSHPAQVREIANRPVPSHNSIEENTDVIGSNTTVLPQFANLPADMFGEAVDDGREVLFRNTIIGTWDAFKVLTQPRELLAAGVDVEHYFKAILSWSNRHNRKRRTAHGWLDTVLGAMSRDKDQGRLRMTNTPSDEERMVRFLQMGR